MRVAGILWLFLAGCGVAREGPSGSPGASDPARETPSGLFEWTVRLDTGSRGLGAYTLILRYTAPVARIEEIRSAGPKAFRGVPEFDPSTFATGVTRVASLDAFGSRPREGPWPLFTVVFRAVGSGMFRATVEIDKLYDENNERCSGRLVESRLERSFP
jgi:hypothetical protein